MPSEPKIKRAFAFFDGQNLFYAAKEAFGYPYPNYDPKLLTERICAAQGWDVAGINFYTGIPSIADKPFWNQFWTAKMGDGNSRNSHLLPPSSLPKPDDLTFRRHACSDPGGSGEGC